MTVDAFSVVTEVTVNVVELVTGEVVTKVVVAVEVDVTVMDVVTAAIVVVAVVVVVIVVDLVVVNVVVTVFVTVIAPPSKGVSTAFTCLCSSSATLISVVHVSKPSFSRVIVALNGEPTK